MDRLERFVIDHRDEFDIHQPNDNLWDKIKKPEKKTKIISLKQSSILWRAAAVVIIFSSAFLLSEFIHYSNSNIPLAETNAVQEEILMQIPALAEAETYYTKQVKMKLTQIKKHNSFAPDLEEQLNYDLAELDTIFAELKADLKDNVANEEVINAMIQNYRMKLLILEEMLTELSDTEKESEHDKNNTVEL